MIFSYIWARVLNKMKGTAILHSTVHRTSKVEAGSQFYYSSMDRHSFCGYDCSIVNTAIGSFTSIASHVIIGGASHPIEWGSVSPVFYKGRDSVKTKLSEHDYINRQQTIVGNDVWIGSNCLIKAGVQIGNGVIIGMGSVVTKDVPDYEIWAGNPAKFVRYRFDPELIRRFVLIKWWQFDDSVIAKHAKYITDANTFIRQFDERVES